MTAATSARDNKETFVTSGTNVTEKRVSIATSNWMAVSGVYAEVRTYDSGPFC